MIMVLRIALHGASYYCFEKARRITKCGGSIDGSIMNTSLVFFWLIKEPTITVHELRSSSRKLRRLKAYCFH